MNQREIAWLTLAVFMAPKMDGWLYSLIVGVQVLLCVVYEVAHYVEKRKVRDDCAVD